MVARGAVLEVRVGAEALTVSWAARDRNAFLWPERNKKYAEDRMLVPHVSLLNNEKGAYHLEMMAVYCWTEQKILSKRCRHQGQKR